MIDDENWWCCLLVIANTAAGECWACLCCLCHSSSQWHMGGEGAATAPPHPKYYPAGNFFCRKVYFRKYEIWGWKLPILREFSGDLVNWWAHSISSVRNFQLSVRKLQLPAPSPYFLTHNTTGSMVVVVVVVVVLLSVVLVVFVAVAGVVVVVMLLCLVLSSMHCLVPSHSRSSCKQVMGGTKPLSFLPLSRFSPFPFPRLGCRPPPLLRLGCMGERCSSPMGSGGARPPNAIWWISIKRSRL